MRFFLKFNLFLDFYILRLSKLIIVALTKVKEHGLGHGLGHVQASRAYSRPLNPGS